MWRSRSWTVISRSAGTSVSTVLPVIGSTRSTPTCMAPMAGMYFDTGSLTNRRPSSYSIMAATDTMGLVIEAIRKIASRGIGAPAGLVTEADGLERRRSSRAGR